MMMAVGSPALISAGKITVLDFLGHGSRPFATRKLCQASKKMESVKIEYVVEIPPWLQTTVITRDDNNSNKNINM